MTSMTNQRIVDKIHGKSGQDNKERFRKNYEIKDYRSCRPVLPNFLMSRLPYNLYRLTKAP